MCICVYVLHKGLINTSARRWSNLGVTGPALKQRRGNLLRQCLEEEAPRFRDMLKSPHTDWLTWKTNTKRRQNAGPTLPALDQRSANVSSIQSKHVSLCNLHYSCGSYCRSPALSITMGQSWIGPDKSKILFAFHR